MNMPKRTTALTMACVLLTGAQDAEAQEPLTSERITQLAETHADSAFALYRELLTFPNDANRPDDIAQLSAWLEQQFERRGFSMMRLDMPGSDALLAVRSAPGAARTVLVYLQADGQPVDPTRWHQDSPWTPVLKARRAGATSVDGNPDDWQTLPWERLYDSPDPEWRIFARSASDSKGPVAQFLSAVSLLDNAGSRAAVQPQGGHRHRRGVGLAAPRRRRAALPG
jgi:acetylornithine deacetylase/succinyl-diaminopimelate desuccinylase-like protein